jgi:WhiB family redox-sensing transcriptional regulator
MPGRPSKSSQLADSLRLPSFILEDDPLCAQVDPELFFPEENEDSKTSYYVNIKAAKKVCSNCPLTIKCLEYALNNGPIQGVWGGLTEKERYNLVRNKRMKAQKLTS